MIALSIEVDVLPGISEPAMIDEIELDHEE